MSRLTDYEQDQTRKKLEKDLDYNLALMNAWKNVTRNYKKNGEPFAALKQNFNGAGVYDAKYSMHSNEKEISVSANTQLSGWISDSISNSALARYDKERFNPSEDRIINETLLEPYFYLTVDEIETRIKDKIKYYEGRVEELKKALDDLNKDIDIMNNLLDYMSKEIAKMSPDAASYFKDKVIRHYY